MLAKVLSAAVIGIEAVPVEVEVDIQSGLSQFSTVGLPDAAVRESRDRVRAALLNSGYTIPDGRVTVNLAPADLRKEGSGYDLAIALGLLAASGLVGSLPGEDLMVVGELSLDGRLKAIRGALPIAMEARKKGCRQLALPQGNGHEASYVEGLEIISLRTLAEAAEFIDGRFQVTSIERPSPIPEAPEGEDNLRDVCGQEAARRAVEITAAGGHNILMSGPPGSGKTMLARRLPGILPRLSRDECLEVMRIRSVAGMIPEGRPLSLQRPFRAPHHTVSAAGMAGGGSRPRPGEITLSHRGVLFLDELPEFSRSVLEVLRQPVESGVVTVSRAAGAVTFPADFMLIASMNPCKCGWLGHQMKECGCTYHDIARYRSRLSGPLLDRIDIHVEVPALEYRELTARRTGEASEIVRRRVEKARALQLLRFAGKGPACNAAMSSGLVREHCRIDRYGDELLAAAVEKLGLSARGVMRVLKVSRTIADLADVDEVGAEHLAEAIQYRCLEGRSP